MAETEAQRKKRIAAKVAARAKERAAYHASVEAGAPSKSSLTTKPKKVSATTAAYLEQEGVSSLRELSRTKESVQKKKVTTRPVIELGKKPEEKGAFARGLEILKGETEAGGLKTGMPPPIIPGGTGFISRLVKGLKGGKRTATAARSLVGNSKGFIVKGAPKGGSFATNTKSIGLTKSLLQKTISVIKNPGFIIGAIGSYPFAYFIKEEAIQTLSIPIMKAVGAGDFETAKDLTDDVDALITDSGGLLGNIPYANVVTRLLDFFKAAGKANDAWKNIIAQSEANVAAEAAEPSFAEEREASDVAAFERKRAFGEEETERFEDIEEERAETRAEEVQAESERFAAIEEERKARAIEDQEIDIMKSEVFALRREGKFEEADELEQRILDRLKGGE